MLLCSIILFFLLVFFKGAEIAFLSADRLNMELGRNENNKRDYIIGKMMDEPRYFLGSIILGGNVTLVVFTYHIAYSLHFALDSVISNPVLTGIILVFLITCIVFFFGEFLPQIMIKIFSSKFLYLFAVPILVTYYLFNVPVRVMYYFSDLFVRDSLKNAIENEKGTFSREDLEEFISKSNSNTGLNEAIDTDLFSNALNLRQIKVRDCMVPRTELISINIESSIDELIQIFKESNLSRVLVEGEDPDNIVGYVHHQQLLHSPHSIRPMVMDIMFVPETINIYDMMDTFVKGKSSIAIVADEFGGTSGVITMEDILEQLFGNIEDEHDVDDDIIEQINENEFLISGRVEIAQINRVFTNLRIPEGDYNTLSGYIVTTTNHIPREGEEIYLDGNRFVIESESDTKIEMVRIFARE